MNLDANSSVENFSLDASTSRSASLLHQHSKPLSLISATVIAAGRERTCFLHPYDASKCIKVANTRRCRQHHREYVYFNRLHRRGTPFIHIPAYHGRIATSHGPGNVFSIVRDYDGAISQDLNHAARHMDHARIIAAAEELTSHFMKWRIITCDMNPGNFLVQKTDTDTIRLVMIDGIGNREFIPVSTYIPFICSIKVERRLKKLGNKLARVLSAAGPLLTASGHG